MTSLSNLKVFATHPHKCSYLEQEQATTLFIDPDTEVDVELYSTLSGMGFRRSGPHIYRPHCEFCTACVPARIPVEQFVPNRQQRKTLNRNRQVQVRAITDINDNQYYQLYEKYINCRHVDGDMYPPSREQYEAFLTNDIGNTHYYEFTLDQQLIAVAVTDQMSDGLSAIYTFFEPELNRLSLGRFAVLWQIERAKTLGLAYVYLGYWIKNCRKMNYKIDYRPIQLLIKNRWQTLN